MLKSPDVTVKYVMWKPIMLLQSLEVAGICDDVTDDVTILRSNFNICNDASGDMMLLQSLDVTLAFVIWHW